MAQGKTLDITQVAFHGTFAERLMIMILDGVIWKRIILEDKHRLIKRVLKSLGFLIDKVGSVSRSENWRERNKDGEGFLGIYPVSYSIWLDDDSMPKISGREAELATKFAAQLCYLLHRKYYHLKDEPGWFESLVGWVDGELTRCQRLKPIVLGYSGEELTDAPYINPPDISKDEIAFYGNESDDHAIGGDAGRHAICGGHVVRIPVSRSSDALVCRNCHLRSVFPKTDMVTYAHLRVASNKVFLTDLTE